MKVNFLINESILNSLLEQMNVLAARWFQNNLKLTNLVNQTLHRHSGLLND
jgi:hypothetical protein